jgi:potassium-dependent mechanosensitive channel
MILIKRLLIFLFCIAIFNTHISAATLSTLDIRQISTDKLHAKIKEVEASTSINPDSAAKLIETYRKTISFLEQTESYRNSIKLYKNAMDNAVSEAEKLVERLENKKQSQADRSENPYRGKLVSELDPLLITEKANRAAVRAKLDELIRKQNYEIDRAGTARQRFYTAQLRQQELVSQYDVLSTSGEDPSTLEAQTWLILSEYHALATEIKMLDQELLSQPMRLQLIQANLDYTRFNLSQLEINLEMLESTISKQRKEEALAALVKTEKALEELDSTNKSILAIAKANTELSIHSSSIAEKLDAISNLDNLVSRENKQLQEDLKLSYKQIEVAGLSQNLGNVLLKKRRQLPDTSEYLRSIKKYNNEIADLMLKQIQHQDEQRQLKQSELYIETILQSYDQREHDQIRNQLTPLIETRLKLLEQAIQLDVSYVRTLGELVAAYQQMLDTTNSYKTLLEERLIWVRNTDLIGLSFIKSIPDDAKKLLDSQTWSRTFLTVIKNLSGSFWFIVIFLVAILVKIKQGSIRQAIINSGIHTNRPSRDRISYTLQALLLSIIFALPISLILFAVSREILRIDEITPHMLGLSRALEITAYYWFILKFTHTICIKKGLAESHFRWSENSLQLLRSAIPRFAMMCTSLVFLFVLLIRLDDESLGGSLGMILFVIFWGIHAHYAYRLFEPETGLLSTLFIKGENSGLRKLDQFTRYVLTIFSCALIVFSLFGYIYGALIFSTALIFTNCFIIGVLVLHQLMIRWLYVNHRRLALKAALEKRAEAQQKAINQEDSEKNILSDEFGDMIEEPEIDLATINEDSRKLLNVFIMLIAFWGLWVIWSNVVPVFSVLDSINLWNKTTIINGESTYSSVTLGDLAFALAITIILFIAVKKLPALLEITFLQRLDISPGSRFTIKTLVNYALVLIGILWVSSLIGISWSKVQWLVAALSVGIGFGLQEIIANFICGIIILFERPIRIGDVVTIGDTDGVVSRIQIRATTIVNWDRKELLVPNKEFITGRLLNWSLSDRVSRIRFPIGIAYGSDVDLAIKLVEEAARENSNVLEEPSPYVSFEEFGDNSLLLYLRCFIEYNDNRIQTITDLHKAIDQKFRDADIVISFPQRDIHFDTSKPLEINLKNKT